MSSSSSAPVTLEYSTEKSQDTILADVPATDDVAPDVSGSAPDTEVSAPAESVETSPTSGSIIPDLQMIHVFLRSGTYPPKATPVLKRRIRAKSLSFVVQGEDLMHKGPKGALTRVIFDDVEKDRIVRNSHGGFGGNHFGQNATIKKVITHLTH
jgi:hypothetical protein